MNNVILDTSVVSFIFKGDSRAGYYTGKIAGLRPCVSFQTMEELQFGACSKNWGSRLKNDLARHLDRYTVVWPNEELVAICAQLRCNQQSAGRRLRNADAWIAATALMLKCPLASHDRDVSTIAGLTLIQAPHPPPPPI